jgi:AcrR family transcriptional regulator
MVKRIATPQALVDQVLRLLPHHPTPPAPAAAETRILDAAQAAFTRHGIRATTMSQIAKDAGISREWLYKHFHNREAVVLGVVRREVLGFIGSLAVRAAEARDFDAAVVDAFVFSVEFLRDHPLLQQVLHTEPESVTPRLLASSSPALTLIVETSAGYIRSIGGLDQRQSTVLAETLVRVVATITLAPRGALDLHDPDQLRRYASAFVPAMVHAARSS